MGEKNTLAAVEIAPLQAIANAGDELCCINCGATEWVLALDDVPFDDTFIANYQCEECEETQLTAAQRSAGG